MSETTISDHPTAAPTPDRPHMSDAPAAQQPHWPDAVQMERVREILRSRPPLVGIEDVDTLQSLLARVSAGEALVVQGGDCAEDPDECYSDDVRNKTELLNRLAAIMSISTGLPVVKVGRIAGQFAKPRSSATEIVDGQELLTYRGHLVNGPEPHAEARTPDPLRLLSCFMAASEVMMHLGWHSATPRATSVEPPVWTSHDALLLDYERSLLRRSGNRTWLGSTHWPWIGERTRQLDGAHVGLLAAVANPVAIKIGPHVRSDEVLALCERLDPDRTPGRLTLIARMGAERVTERLTPLVREVVAADFPVIWMSDPMHGNTRTTSSGRKFRVVDDLIREVHAFRAAVRTGGGIAGGLHLETTPHAVTECVATTAQVHEVESDYRTFCDPRLNPDQSAAVVASWAG